MRKFGLISGMSAFPTYAIGVAASIIVIRTVISGLKARVLYKSHLSSLALGYVQTRPVHPRRM